MRMSPRYKPPTARDMKALKGTEANTFPRFAKPTTTEMHPRRCGDVVAPANPKMGKTGGHVPWWWWWW